MEISELQLFEVAWNRASGEAPALYCPRTYLAGTVSIGQRLQRLQNFQLFISHGIGIHRCRRLHRHEAEKLQHVVLHHVAQRASRVIVTGAAL